MKIATQQMGDRSIIKIEGSLSNENIYEVEKRFKAAAEKKKHILMDMTEVDFVCSAALGLMLEYMNKSKTQKTHFAVFGVKEDIKKLFVLTELHKHLPLYNSLDDVNRFIDEQK